MEQGSEKTYTNAATKLPASLDWVESTARSPFFVSCWCVDGVFSIPSSFYCSPLHSLRLIFDVTLLSLMHPILQRKMTVRKQADGIIPFSLLPDPSPV